MKYNLIIHAVMLYGSFNNDLNDVINRSKMW